MDQLITILGIILVVAGASFPAVRHVMKDSKARPHKGDVPIGFFIGILGILMIIQTRITSIPTPFGKLQAATAQALADAGDIATLKSQAQTQTATINLVADQATKAKTLSETVAKQVAEAQDKLATLGATLTAAQAILDKTKQEEDFMMTVVAAQGGDDRQSFDKLRIIADDRTSPFANMASESWLAVIRAHNSPFSQSGFTVPWNDGVDPAKLDMNELTSTYYSAPVFLRAALLEYISNRNDIPKQPRLDFFMQVITSDKSLMAMEYAGRYFVSLSMQPPNTNPMNVEGLSSWWKEHRKDFDGK